MLLMMQYLSELVHAQLEYQKPRNIPEGILVEDLIDISHRSHMDYLILGALLKTDLSEEIKAGIRPYVIGSTMKTLAQVCCINELVERFEKENIFYQVLKGAVMKYIYPSPEMREMSDIDIMIYDVSLTRAKKVVEDMGFTLFKSVKHHDIYVKSPFLIIELHYALYDKNVDKNQYEYFQNKQTTHLEGKEYGLEFSKEGFYVYLIAHMAKHFYETGCGIRNVLDVYCFRKLNRNLNEVIITEELDKCGLRFFEHQIRNLARVWLEGYKPDRLSLLIFEYMVDCGIYGKGENGVWGQLVKDMMHKPDKYQSYAKKWYYFPPISYMENDYTWLKKYPYLLVVAWVIRAVHGLLSKDGRKKRKMLLNINNEEVNTLKDIYTSMHLDFKK